MTEGQRNYGIEPDSGNSGSGGFGAPSSAATMSPSDENTWSVLAHLSVFLNLFTGIGGPVAALVIWLVYKDRSQRVSFHALQSLWYQVAWMVLLTVGWTISGILTVVLIGFLLMIPMFFLSLLPFVQAVYAAYKVNEGVDYRYPWVADMIGGEHKAGM